MSSQTQPAAMPSTPMEKSASHKPYERKPHYKFPSDPLSKSKKATAGVPTSPSLNRAGRPLVDFYIFPKFPAEVQDGIWEYACFDVTAIEMIVKTSVVMMVGPVPALPGLLHATSGSRAIGLRYYEVMESFVDFDRNVPRPFPPFANPAVVPPAGPAPVQAAVPFAPNALANIQGAGMGANAGGFAQLGPGHVLGGAINNPNGTVINTAGQAGGNAGGNGVNGGNLLGAGINNPNGTAVNPAGHLGNGGAHGGNVGNGGVFGHANIPNNPWTVVHRRVNRGRNPGGETSEVILFGAFPVTAGNIVGYFDKPAPAHPLLPVEPERKILPGRVVRVHKFWVNISTAMFKLQLGDGVTQYQHPTFSLAEERNVLPPKNGRLTNFELEDRVAHLQSRYYPPSPFPIHGKLPVLLEKAEHLLLNLTLPPCKDPENFSTYADKCAHDLLTSLNIRNIIGRLPNLKSINFYIPGDHKIDPFVHKMQLKHWPSLLIRQTDRLTFGRSQFEVLEREMKKFVGVLRKDAGRDDIFAPRLMAYVPERGDRMEYDANFPAN